MSMMIQKFVVRTVLVCAAFLPVAVGVNHHDHPCTGASVGAAGMCVPTQIGGAA
ncbi:hypothetical protein O7602_26605 [Micromonospora sp. WMMD1128]|uniref:hypothetical protein n=1 Tax=Micromonospora sp. WMMD1128 TaxID=3015150 RepID=UPI00248AB277|nr:hypothetical protein [Micromonospora sp. WMMD1128]WBB73215.1 hypothetical protein O7602_26605 [Micromonospora sp. WMMD1128]